MERVSSFEIFKIGVGPSSSHTVGPWKAANDFINSIPADTDAVKVELFGSLAKTGKGHGTDMAVIMGLLNLNIKTCDIDKIPVMEADIRNKKCLPFNDKNITFNPEKDIIFNFKETKPFHSNAAEFSALKNGEVIFSQLYYSIGGGFIIKDGEDHSKDKDVELLYPIDSADDLLKWCNTSGKKMPELIYENEQNWNHEEDVDDMLREIWETMKQSAFKGAKTGFEGREALDTQRPRF